MESANGRGQIRFWHWIAAIVIAVLVQIGLLGAIFSSEPAKPKAAQPGMVLQLTALNLPGPIPGVSVVPNASASSPKTIPTAPPPEPSKTKEPTREPEPKQPVKARPKAESKPKPEVSVQTSETPKIPPSKNTLPEPGPTKRELALPRVDTATPSMAPSTNTSRKSDPSVVQSSNQVLETATPVGSLAAAMPGTEVAQLKTLYERRLLTWLAEHKLYPLLARRRGLEGVAEVTFKLDASGRVQTSSLSASSGHSILDRAAMQLLEQASPMPTPPDAINPDSLMFRVPIAFTLR